MLFPVIGESCSLIHVPSVGWGAGQPGWERGRVLQQGYVQRTEGRHRVCPGKEIEFVFKTPLEDPAFYPTVGQEPDSNLTKFWMLFWFTLKTKFPSQSAVESVWVSRIWIFFKSWFRYRHTVVMKNSRIRINKTKSRNRFFIKWHGSSILIKFI